MPWLPIAAVFGIVILTTLATFWFSATLVRQLYGGSTREAFRHQLLIALGKTRGFQIVEDGRTVLPADSGLAMGPRLVIIRPSNAVTMVNGGKITRVAGPGILRSDRFEYVRDVHDLREQQESYAFENVLSHDLIETDARVTLTYALDISEAAKQGATPLSPSEELLLRRLPHSMPHWEDGTRRALEQSVRQVVGSQSLTDLLTRSHIRSLEQRIINIANDRTLVWGIRVRNVIIECLQPKPEIVGAASSLWIAEANVGVELAKSQAFKGALQVIADAYRQAIELGMPEDGIRREILRRTLEQLGKDPATTIVITPELPSTYARGRSSSDDDSPS